MRAATLILDNFPNLDFCEVIDKNTDLTKSLKIEALARDESIIPWLTWASSYTNDYRLLRTRLKNGKRLLLLHLSEEHLLVLLNEKENSALLLRFLSTTDFSESLDSGAVHIDAVAPVEHDPKLQDAKRIQKLIIPRDSLIKKKLKNFFVVLEQQDAVGGDFYWYRETPQGALLAVVDCTGHSVEGAMASMVCNSLLNQSFMDFDSQDVSKFALTFYENLNEYNQTANEILDYGLGAELGVFHFNYEEKKIVFVSTGISAFVKNSNGVELMKMRKLMDYSNVATAINEKMINMDEVTGIYTFTDGLTDQYDSQDAKKLGYKGVKRMIEEEKSFDHDYYASEIHKWRGGNMQYDDITLFGVAI